MTERKAYIFDLDGTLTDSAPGIMRSARYALEQMGKPVPEERILRRFLGPPLAVSFTQFCGLTEQEAIQATAHYRDRYHAIGWRENIVYPGIRSLLLDLKEQGHYLGVATGKPQDAAELILKHYALYDLFDRVIGPDPTHYFATKEELLTEAMGDEDLPRFMIGDRDTDLIAADKLGVQGVGALYGYGGEGELAAVKHHHLVDSVAMLRTALDVPAKERPGYFISFEGNDGCGKSTQVSLLYDYLRDADFPVLRTREPGGSAVAEKIRHLLLDRGNHSMQDMTEALLFAAARAQHVRDVIRPALQQGRLVVCDRYVDSSIAYQGAGKGLGMELVRQINAPAIDGCLPDLTFLLEIDADTAMARRMGASAADRLEALDMSFHSRVSDGFRTLAEQNPQRIVRVPAQGSAEDIASRVRGIALKRLKEAGLA